MRLPQLTFGKVLAGTAVLLVATSGTAYAANTIGSGDIIDGSIKSVDVKDEGLTSVDYLNNNIKSEDLKDGDVRSVDIKDEDILTGDIRNGQVRGQDIRDEDVTTNDIADGTLTTDDILNGTITGDDIADGSIASADVLDESLTNADLGTDSVQATEVADNSLDSGEIIDFGLSNEDIGVLEAEVNANGTLGSSDHFGTTSSHIGTGTYQVDFGINVSFCTPVVAQGEAGVGGAGGAVMGVTDRAGNPNAFFVTTRNGTGAFIDTAFHIIVVC